MEFSDIFDKSAEVRNYADCFKDGKIENIKVFEAQKRIEITLRPVKTVKKSVIMAVAKDIRSVYGLGAIKIFTHYEPELFSAAYYPEILTYITLKFHGSAEFLEGSEAQYSDGTLTITLVKKGKDMLISNGIGEDIKKLVSEEFDLELEVEIIDGETDDDYFSNIDDYNSYRDEMIQKTIEEEMGEALKAAEERKNSPIVMGNEISGKVTPMVELSSDSGKVIVEGELFHIEEKETRTGAVIFNMYISDPTSAVIVKRFFRKAEEAKLFKEKVSIGDCLSVRGETVYDKYMREFIIEPFDINKFPKKYREDNSEEKRVELHLHTKMSAVDGVSEVTDLIKAAARWGHKAIAITDHGVLQAYPEAYKISKKLGIKILYGVECYMVDDLSEIYKGKEDYPIDTEFVVFDVETTGLSAETEVITEIGAVKIKNGEVIDRFSKFINPKRKLSQKIIELTHITDEMLADAPTEDVIVPEFMEFAGNGVFVAHNADFDMGFLRMACQRLGIELNNSYVDTLELARSLYPHLKNHKLDTIAKETGVSLEGHHRAVNDAEALYGIFKVFLEKLKEKDIKTLKELNAALPKNVDSLRPYHGIIIVKNKTGLLNLYKLVSKSNLLHYKKRPRMLKSELIHFREGLIYGSACEAGELYRTILRGAKQEDIENIAKFYDFLEIQPLGNNRFMIDNGTVRGDDDLIRLNMEIVKLGEKLKIPVVATGDVHFLNPEDSVYRKILMYGHGFKDADNQAPLYLRTTEEMLDEFKYIPEEKRREIVIENPNKIADMCEDKISPIPEEKHPPYIPGCEEDLSNMSHEKAKRIYGEPLPKIVQDRMDKELNSIISNGYAVMYIIAQKLVKKSLDDGYLVGSRGSVGSSFVAFLSDITEVNSLCPHYICPKCKHSEFFTDGEYSSGCDMPPKDCPECGSPMKRDGHDIPFETFLGFAGDKEPDIDLNFSGEYQPVIHKYTEEIFGEGHVFRAGTISTIAEKNAMGFVRKYAEEKGLIYHNAQMMKLAIGCNGVKKTTGQHPGGVMIVPKENEVYEFTPVAHPADDPNSDIVTTHFAYTYLHDCLLKLDLLGHDDPTMIRMLQDLTGLDPKTIPLEDEATKSLFLSTEALGITKEDIDSEVGTLGVPEFGTKFVRQMLVDTKPTTFAELVRISGLSHGTDVWLGNAQELIENGTVTLKEAICTRDDIMLYLIHKGVQPKLAFTIMESVRKGKGLKPEWEEEMKANDVPDWYIGSCKKIKYMFPKAHAVAYVTMAFRIAYYKVHYPLAYYATYFSVRADDFDIDLMVGDKVERNLKEYQSRPDLNQKDKNIITILEMCNEMQKRGIHFANVDLYKSDSKKFIIEDNTLRMPFTAIKGLGLAAAQTIVEARKDGDFFSKEDLMRRTKISKTHLEQLDALGCTKGLPDSAQMTLFG